MINDKSFQEDATDITQPFLTLQNVLDRRVTAQELMHLSKLAPSPSDFLLDQCELAADQLKKWQLLYCSIYHFQLYLEYQRLYSGWTQQEREEFRDTAAKYLDNPESPLVAQLLRQVFALNKNFFQKEIELKKIEFENSIDRVLSSDSMIRLHRHFAIRIRQPTILDIPI